MRPLSIPINFVNYEPTFKFQMNKNQTSNSVEPEIKSPEESSPASDKPNASTPKGETKVFKVKEKNIGLLSKGKLKKKLDDATGTVKTKAPKRNRNGKQGINKSNNYAYVQNAARKTCFNCGNTNHIAIDCRKNKKKETVMSRSDIRNRLVNYKPQNPCSHCGSKWHSIFMCNEYHNLYYNNYEPLPKFYRKANSDKADNVSHEHASVNLNSDKANY